MTNATKPRTPQNRLGGRQLDIREAVNQRRQVLGLSYEELAARSGVHRTTLARWLGPSAVGPKLSTGERVMRALGFTGLSRR